MVAITAPTEDELYLLAILDSADGLDLAEFAWFDPEASDGCYRAWDFQWPWYTCNDQNQIDQGGRALGKTVGIKMRAFAFPFFYEGQSMLLTAPELNHLRPLTDAIEKALLTTRLMREMLPGGKGAGIARQPHWQVRFKNGTSLISRLPNKDGKGVKGCNAGSHTFTWGDGADAQTMTVPGALVLTRRGNIPIESVVVGDEVLTHKGRWRPVQATYHYPASDTIEVAGAGHRGLLMSETHGMYARRNSNPQRSKNLEPPIWVTPFVQQNDPEFTKRYYFGSPTVVPGWDYPWMPHRDSEALLRLAGAYVADGCPQRDSLLIVDHEDDMPRLAAIADSLGIGYGIHDHSTKGNRAKRLILHERTGRSISTWIVEEFGSGAGGKRIPVWLLAAPEHLRKAFLDEYTRGDGHWDELKGRWQVSSASKELIIGLRLLGQSLGYACNYSWVDPKVTHIMGVKLKKAPQRSHRLTMTVSQRNVVVEDGIAWQKVRSVKPGPECDVYDLTVEEDHSYLVDGLISHNQHVINIEQDEAQDYPLAGWIEIVETLNAGLPGAMWRCHGVSKGIRDRFFEKTQPDSGWTVHRPMAMHRPTWGDKERQSKIKEYGGSRQAIDYRRNIYGEHGDASNSVFVLARLMQCVDIDEGSTYNQDVYVKVGMEYEHFPTGASDAERLHLIRSWIDLPGSHKHGYSQKVGNKEVGSPKGYSAYWGGMDVGVTTHPSELLVFGQRTGTDFLELLTRIQMHRINTDDQMEVVSAVMDWYGPKLRLGIDKTGVGFPIWDMLTRRPTFGDRIYGFGFSEKRVVAIEDRALVGSETIKDLARLRNFVEGSTDWLRNDYVDAGRMRLPYDREVLIEFQGQVYTVIKDNGDPYGIRRLFGGGSFHTLDAAKIAIGTKHIPPLEALLEEQPVQQSVLDVFLGA